MRLYALLIFVLFVVRARAATIPNPATSDISKKIEDAVKDVLTKDQQAIENVSSEQELIDQANIITEVENKLRAPIQTAESIPVKVVVEDVKPLLKTDNNKKINNDLSDIDFAEYTRTVDLSNPGIPQRQEHETQNPEYHDHIEQTVANLKQTVVDAQNVFNQNFQGVTQGIQNWFSNNEQIASIQQSIQNLQESFTTQITKLNETLQGFWKPEESGSTESAPEGSQIKSSFQDPIQSRLKIVDNNFKAGVKALSEGVEILAILKAEPETPQKPTNPEPTNPISPAPPAPNPLQQYLQMFQNTMLQGLNNVTSAIQNMYNQYQQGNSGSASGNGSNNFLQGWGTGIQNIFNNNPQNTTITSSTNNTQSDEPVYIQTQRPTIWQGIQSSFQNIFNQGQAVQSGPPGTQADQPAPINSPIVTAIQNNPFVQGVVNLLQPNRPTEKPAAPPAQGTNAVPVSNTKPDEAKPDAESQQQKQPEKEINSQPAVGPIQQIIQQNPIVQGIAGAVQRISNIGNPEKPRDTVKDAEKDEALKGGFWKPGYGAGGNGGSEHNNDSERLKSADPEKTEQNKEIISDEPKKVNEENQPEVVPLKTE